MEIELGSRSSQKKYYLIFYVFFLVGIAGHFSESYYSIMLTLTPYILLAMGILVLFLSGVLRSKQFVYWFIITYVITLSLEIAGVKTGKIFGEYTYGDVLGLKLSGVPLIIGFNWLFVIAGAYSLSSLITRNKFLILIVAALFSVLFDYLLEPVAVNLGYWQWSGGVIPLQNYIAWFLISLSASAGLLFLRVNLQKDKETDLFLHYFFAQIIFFLALNFR